MTRGCYCSGGCAGAGGWTRGRFAHLPACDCWCHDGERSDWYGTGIPDEKAARRYLKNKFRHASLEQLVVRPGARFYVTARSGTRTAFLLGPYSTHSIALMHVQRGRSLCNVQSAWGVYWEVGTASSPETIDCLYGR